MHGLDQHFLGLMVHNKCAGAGHLVVDIAVVVVNVDSKVVHCGGNLLYQHIGTVTLVTVVKPIEGDKVWVPPASAVAVTFPVPAAAIRVNDTHGFEAIGTGGHWWGIALQLHNLHYVVILADSHGTVTQPPGLIDLSGRIKIEASISGGFGWCAGR